MPSLLTATCGEPCARPRSSLGSVGEWLFRHVAGIELDPETPGFQKFVLRPFIGGGLRFVRASYRTMHGEIGSEWKRVGKRLTWTTRIPANTSARVYVPSRPTQPVTEGGKPIDRAAGIRVVGREADCLVCDAVAGTYSLGTGWKTVTVGNRRSPPPKCT